MAASAEPQSCQDLKPRAIKILDADDKKGGLTSIVNSYIHLKMEEREQFLSLLNKYTNLFDGSLGVMDTEPVSLELKKNRKSYHGKA